MMWNLPQGSDYVTDKPCKHPADDCGIDYYRLVLFERTGIYALLGMCGEIRTCSQRWATKEATS